LLEEWKELIIYLFIVRTIKQIVVNTEKNLFVN